MKKKDMVKNYARAILLAQKIREESYDHKAAKKEKKKMEKKYPDSEYNLVDYSTFYTKDVMQSTQEACKEVGLPVRLSYPMYLGMEWWNDMQEWACEVLGKEAKQYTMEEKE